MTSRSTFQRASAPLEWTQLLARTAAVLFVAAMALTIVWATPVVAAWVHSGRLPSLRVVDACAALLDGRLFGPDPAVAYPRSVARWLPGQWGFWSTGALFVIALCGLVLAAARAADVRMSRPNPDRRWWQLHGLRPHEFGRYRTVSELIVDGPSPDRVIVGRFAWPRKLLAITNNVQMAVIAAPRTGKSSGLVIPAILEHEGPILTTSVRTDIAEHTLGRRRRLGRVWVWDPFGRDSDAWDLLQGCEDWEHALLVARWLGHARKIGQGINQDYFDQEAEGLVAPYLHAAALTPDVTAAGVYRWILERDMETALGILEDAGADDALNRLQSVYAYTERQRDGIIGTAAVQLKAYGHPAAARTARRGEGVTPEALFNGSNTLYIVAGREHQQLLAPLVVTLVSSMLHALSERENRTGAGLSPPALFALDETASIAPIEDLPQILATSLGSGVRFLTVWHSVAQIRRHFGADAAAEILALSQAKLFMGSITDQYTRQEITELLGRRQLGAGRDRERAEVMTAQALQRLTGGEGLLINGELPPVLFHQRRHYLDRDLRRLKGPAELSSRLPAYERLADDGPLEGRPTAVGSIDSSMGDADFDPWAE